MGLKATAFFCGIGIFAADSIICQARAPLCSLYLNRGLNPRRKRGAFGHGRDCRLSNPAHSFPHSSNEVRRHFTS